MAVNTEEENLNNPIENQQENTPDKITSTSDTETINQNQETENMEVHHHPNLHHKPKPWKEYFLEFLMIFLAVTLGFFAENIREHFIDTKKGKEYAISLKEDLLKDTLIIQKTIWTLNRDIAGCDSLNGYLQNERTKTVRDLQKLYQYNLSALGGFSFSLTDRTSSQLKNSGGMRLLTNKEVIDGILDYWESASILNGIQTATSTLRQQAREKTYLIFDNQYYSDKSDSLGTRDVATNSRLMTDNYIQLAELRNRLNHFKNTIKGPLLKGLINQKMQAIKLIQLIKTDYE